MHRLRSGTGFEGESNEHRLVAVHRLIKDCIATCLRRDSLRRLGITSLVRGDVIRDPFELIQFVKDALLLQFSRSFQELLVFLLLVLVFQ